MTGTSFNSFCFRLHNRRQEEREWDRQLSLAFSLSSSDVILKWRWQLGSAAGSDHGWGVGWPIEFLLRGHLDPGLRWNSSSVIHIVILDSSRVWMPSTEMDYFSPSLKKKQIVSQPLAHMVLILNGILADVDFHVRNAHSCRSFVLSVLHHVTSHKRTDVCRSFIIVLMLTAGFFHSFTSLDSCISSRTCAITPHLWGCVYKYLSVINTPP